VTSCSLVEVYLRLEERTAFIVRVRESFKQATSVNLYQTAGRHISEDSTLHIHRGDDLLSSFLPICLREIRPK
jgi:hypothetical protein